MLNINYYHLEINKNIQLIYFANIYYIYWKTFVRQGIFNIFEIHCIHKHKKIWKNYLFMVLN